MSGGEAIANDTLGVAMFRKNAIYPGNGYPA